MWDDPDSDKMGWVAILIFLALVLLMLAPFLMRTP